VGRLTALAGVLVRRDLLTETEWQEAFQEIEAAVAVEKAVPGSGILSSAERTLLTDAERLRAALWQALTLEDGKEGL
jgi:hypothetical protein